MATTHATARRTVHAFVLAGVVSLVITALAQDSLTPLPPAACASLQGQSIPASATRPPVTL